MPTVTGLFEDFSTAQNAVQHLIDDGFAPANISLVAYHKQQENVRYQPYDKADVETGKSTTSSAVGGGVLGGVLGLLISAGTVTIPGIGLVVMAGPLASAVGSVAAGTITGAGVGAASGGLIGALMETGLSKNEAHILTQEIRHGGALVLVSTEDDATSERVSSILEKAGAMDMETVRQRATERNEQNVNRRMTTEEHTLSQEEEWKETSKVGTTGGAAAGAVTGASVGSVAGPPGAIGGGAVGAVAGTAAGAAGDVAGKRLKEKERGE
jgi:hypothetical protein